MEVLLVFTKPIWIWLFCPPLLCPSLWSTLHSSAILIFWKHRSEHPTTPLISFLWLPTAYRIMFKFLGLAFQAHHSLVFLDHSLNAVPQLCSTACCFEDIICFLSSVSLFMQFSPHVQSLPILPGDLKEAPLPGASLIGGKCLFNLHIYRAWCILCQLLLHLLYRRMQGSQIGDSTSDTLSERSPLNSPFKVY